LLWERERAFTSNVDRVIDACAEPLADVCEDVARVIFGGGAIVFPTDTSYAIGCDPYRPEAIDRIYAAKGRADTLPLTLHVASPQEFLEYAGDSPLAALTAKRLLPGPVIVLIQRPRFVPDDLAAALTTLAIRVPDDPFTQTLLERCGPFAGTTVNRKNEPRYEGGEERGMLPPADLLVEHGATHYQSESSIVDITGGHPRLLREGVVSYDRLVELLGPVERPTVKVRNQR
jgi:L-threonylcarbamoyladenylate synthase